ncbi:ankyrin repeat domain-containing protein [Flavobacterium kingsejongi]|uniref:Uncharacterized protein n=1 Tax=Flavobacterium kingsejongi TaxID=1678728 RepID=A0A2S1LQ05_9FLAO|nr:ankyrin repeat domain-containing protein [Flavobacterium kingsejongi]AWG25833.1 hypothetical protein FK004_11675 [Flavobacterium kingsejongi]
MKTIEEIKLLLLNSDYESLKESLNDYDINSFDTNGNNILHYYINSNQSVKIKPELVIDLLVSKGLDINQKQIKGAFKRSPLHISVFIKQQEITDYLIKLGADINSTDLNGNNILMTAISRIKFGENGEYFIKKLIENNADINQLNNHGRSAKMSGIENEGNEAIHKYFI